MNYFKLVKSTKIGYGGCCNFVPNGPYGKKDYCLLCLPPWDDYECRIKTGRECTWFVEAVLPTDKALLYQWKQEQKGSIENRKTCASCGKKFLPKSNRQVRCEKCGAKNAINAAKERVRKHRANNGSSETV
jgi:DNA-directed RNA polymerase subunit RPC12/RpoP